MSAEEICNELGFSPEEAQDAYDLVQNRIEQIENTEEEMTAQSITNDTTVFRHQLVTGPDDTDFVVTGLNKHAIELTEVDIGDDGMEWFDSTTYTPGDVVMDFEPQFETVEGQQIPVWAY